MKLVITYCTLLKCIERYGFLKTIHKWFLKNKLTKKRKKKENPQKYNKIIHTRAS